MEDVIIDVEGFESYAEMPEMKGTKIKLIPSEAIMREKMYSGIQIGSVYHIYLQKDSNSTWGEIEKGLASI